MDLVTPKRDAHFYWTLFKSTFLISAFTVGGGFVIIPLLKQVRRRIPLDQR